MSKQYLAAMTVNRGSRYFVEMVGEVYLSSEDIDDLTQRMVSKFVDLGVGADCVAAIYIHDSKVIDGFELPPLQFGPGKRYIVFVRFGRVTDKEVAELKPYIAKQFAIFAQCSPQDIQVIIIDSISHFRVSEVIL